MDTGRSKASSPLATTSLLDPVENKASSAAKPLAGTATGDAPLATAKRHATEAQTLHTYKILQKCAAPGLDVPSESCEKQRKFSC